MAPIHAKGCNDRQWIHPTFGVPAIKLTEAMDSAKFRNYVDQKQLEIRLGAIEDDFILKKADIFRTKRDMIDLLTSLKYKPRDVDASRISKRMRSRELSKTKKFLHNIDDGNTTEKPRRISTSTTVFRKKTDIFQAAQNTEVYVSNIANRHNSNARRQLKKNNSLDLFDDFYLQRNQEQKEKEAKMALERRNTTREERQTRNMFRKTLININRKNSNIITLSANFLKKCGISDVRELKESFTSPSKCESDVSFSDCNQTQLRVVNELTKFDGENSSIGDNDNIIRPKSGASMKPNANSDQDKQPVVDKSKIMSTWRRNTWDNFKQLNKIHEKLGSNAETEVKKTERSDFELEPKIKSKLVRRHTEPILGNERTYTSCINPKIHATVDIPAIFDRIDDLISKWKKTPAATAKLNALEKAPLPHQCWRS